MEACAKRGLAPRVLDVFDGGRMEEFVPSTDLFQRGASRARSSDSLTRPCPESEHKAGVASSLARMHLIDDVEMPPECSVFPVVWRWHRFVFGEHYESPTRTLVAPGGERIELDGRALGRDIGALQEYLRGRSPVVLAHKDLNGANVLERTSDHSLVFVDFEYAAPAARGFDIAHHFVEYSGTRVHARMRLA